jgi:anti-sigma regulatory factor (Ser/Thr protein kinase)
VEKKIIVVPSIRDDERGFERILKISDEIFKQPKLHFDFNFTNCSKLDHNAIVMLGGIARYVDYQNTKTTKAIVSLLNSQSFASAGVMFKVDTMSNLISSQLIGNNFLSHFSRATFEGYPTGDYIGYREHNSSLDSDNIADHLSKQWLSPEKLLMSDSLKRSIVSRIFEIFMNAYGHGTSVQPIEKLGVYSCGQYDKKDKKLNLSVLDFGPGIVENVRKHRNDPLLDDVSALRWALQRGNSTRTDSAGIDMPRGLGFDLLNEFIALNEGELHIYSNSVKAISRGRGVYDIRQMDSHLPGTLISIKINCDSRSYYRFESEPSVSAENYY